MRKVLLTTALTIAASTLVAFPPVVCAESESGHHAPHAKAFIDKDIDNDGIRNRKDMDDDNDGITDALDTDDDNDSTPMLLILMTTTMALPML
ncbi:MAG: hypothetical protein IPK95_02905 [Cellvibrionales bacterium]|nr:hypothetical protein [Cellvibrionales bacterium]